MPGTGRWADLQVLQRIQSPSNNNVSSRPCNRLNPLSVSWVNRPSSFGDHFPQKNFRADLSVSTLSMALNLPFCPRTLVPCERGRLYQTGGIELSQKPWLCQQRSQARASATFASGDSAIPGIEGNCSRSAVCLSFSAMDASASASNPRNRSRTVVTILSSSASGGRSLRISMQRLSRPKSSSMAPLLIAFSTVCS